MLSLPDFQSKQWLIVFPVEGQKLAIKNDNIIISDSDNKILLQTSCYRVYTIWIIGNTTLTTVLMERSKKFGFSIHLLNLNLKSYGFWNAPTEGNVLLRKKQYAYNSIEIAKSIVKNKICNQITLLKSIRIKSDTLKVDIKKLELYTLDVVTSNDTQILLGVEGNASKLYFKHWFEKLEWIGRKPRTKMNPINTILDIGYTVLFNFIDSLLDLYGFDKYYGVYHKTFYQRKSLSCDLMEPLRCLIDNQALKSFNLNQFSDEDFEVMNTQYKLKISRNKDVQRIFVQALLAEKTEIFAYIQSYYRSFMKNSDSMAYIDYKL